MTQLQFHSTQASSLIMYLTQGPSMLFLGFSFSVSFHLKRNGGKPRVDLYLVSLYKSDPPTHGLVKVSQGLPQSTASRCHGSSSSLVEMQFKDECRSVEALLYFLQGQNYCNVFVWRVSAVFLFTVAALLMCVITSHVSCRPHDSALKATISLMQKKIRASLNILVWNFLCSFTRYIICSMC